MNKSQNGPVSIRILEILGVMALTHSLTNRPAEINGHGYDFGHEIVAESMSEADSDTTFSKNSDTNSGKGMTSDADTTWTRT